MKIRPEVATSRRPTVNSRGGSWPCHTIKDAAAAAKITAQICNHNGTGCSREVRWFDNCRCRSLQSCSMWHCPTDTPLLPPSPSLPYACAARSLAAATAAALLSISLDCIQVTPIRAETPTGSACCSHLPCACAARYPATAAAGLLPACPAASTHYCRCSPQAC